jgi:hypothetical protein
MTPEERAALVTQMDRVREQKLQALRHPGASWREWFYYDALKWWIGLGFLIVDVWIVGWWIQGAPAYAGLLVLLLAIYLEFLGFRYLWYRPKDQPTVRRGSFRPTWTRPVEFGRWTPEAKLVREGLLVPGADEGPSPKEFA